MYLDETQTFYQIYKEMCTSILSSSTVLKNLIFHLLYFVLFVFLNIVMQLTISQKAAFKI